MTTKVVQTSSSLVRRSKVAPAVGAFAATILTAVSAFDIHPANAAQPAAGCLQKSQQSACDASALTSAPAENPTPTVATASIAHTALTNPTLDKQLADVLLGICYVGLPVGVTLAILLHDKHAHDRHARLKAQVALLERLWKQSI